MMLLTPTAFVWGAFDEEFARVLDETKLEATGLEVDNSAQLNVLVEGVPEAGKKIGLTSERIEARVNQSLRKAGITPVNNSKQGYLYLNVNVIPNGSFTIRITFKRWV